jgi:hypothetical protein
MDHEVELLRTWGPDQQRGGNHLTTRNGLEPPSTEPNKASINQNDCTTVSTNKGTTNRNSTNTMGSTTTTQRNNKGNEDRQPERATDQQTDGRKEQNVRYEFFDRRNEAPRDTLDELKGMLEEIQKADANALIGSVFIQNAEIRQHEEFPASIQGLDGFFERAVVQSNAGRKTAIGFTILSVLTLQELKERNERDLQHYLQDRRTVLKIHKFDTLTIEQVGWFACKITGTHSERFEYELEQDLVDVVAGMNDTEEYQGDNRIRAIPKFEISRSKVFEMPGDSRSAQAVDIRCEACNAETLKNILVHANVDIAKFGTFMLFSARLTNPDLHWTMFNKHAAFLHDVVVISVEGLHLEVLQEMVLAIDGSGDQSSVGDILVATMVEGSQPLWAIEYTHLSHDEGKFLFLTNRAGARAVENIIDNDLKYLAHKTQSHREHLNDGPKFRQGIKRVTRRARHEYNVRAKHNQVTDQERESARIGARNRPTMVSAAPWTLAEYPLCMSKEGEPNHQVPPTYDQAPTYAQATTHAQLLTPTYAQQTMIGVAFRQNQPREPGTTIVQGTVKSRHHYSTRQEK